MNKNKTRISHLRNFVLKSFTLVEITMAIGIIGIGMTGVMALLPIGFNATRDAMADNYSSNMADQFLHIIASQAKQNWATWIVGSTKIKEFMPIFDPPDTPDKGNALFGDGSGGMITPTTVDAFGLYETSISGVYYAEARSGSIKDFSAHIKVWKSPVRTSIFEGSWTVWPAEYDQAAALNLEISWPVEKPYNLREKRYYYMEIFKPK